MERRYLTENIDLMTHKNRQFIPIYELCRIDIIDSDKGHTFWVKMCYGKSLLRNILVA